MLIRNVNLFPSVNKKHTTKPKPFECLILKRSCKSEDIKQEQVLQYRNFALFIWVSKKFCQKPETYCN